MLITKKRNIDVTRFINIILLLQDITFEKKPENGYWQRIGDKKQIYRLNGLPVRFGRYTHNLLKLHIEVGNGLIPHKVAYFGNW